MKLSHIPKWNWALCYRLFSVSTKSYKKLTI